MGKKDKKRAGQRSAMTKGRSRETIGNIKSPRSEQERDF